MDDAGIEELLDELAERIEQSKPVLGNSQKRQVEIGPIFEILDEIRDIFPEELRQARIIVRDRQEVIDDAMAREREMRVGAEDYADQIFANLETNLDNLLKNVTRCRQRLNSGMTD